MVYLTQQESKSIFSDLRSPGLLGRKPIIGLIIFAAGSLIFFVLAFNLVKQGPLIKWDLPLAQSLHALALKSPPFVINIMVAAYYIGKQAITVIALLFIVYFFYKKFWREFAMLLASFGLAGPIFLLLSHLFNRPRPFLLFEKPIWPGSPNIPGFPSGHTLNLMALCGFLVYLLLPKIRSSIGKFLFVLGVFLLMVYIGFSRLFIGDHYLTDIIAGYAVGLAWFGLSCTVVELIFQRSKKAQ